MGDKVRFPFILLLLCSVLILILLQLHACLLVLRSAARSNAPSFAWDPASGNSYCVQAGCADSVANALRKCGVLQLRQVRRVVFAPPAHGRRHAHATRSRAPKDAPRNQHRAGYRSQ
jgi:hypothetical protein